MPSFSITSNLKLRKFLGKITMAFSKKSIHNITDTDCQIIKEVWTKNLRAALSFIDFSKVFHSIHRGKMEQILQTYCLPKETVTAIMMLYKNTKVMVHSPNGDTNFFNGLWSFTRRYISILYVYNIPRLHNWTSKDIIKSN